VEPSLQEAISGTHYQFQRLGYFSVDKDATASKLVFNKTVGLKDAWEEKDKKEANLLMNTQKEINKYVKEKDDNVASTLLASIVNNIESIDNYSLLTQTVTKNIKNDNNALLFSNLILKYSNKVSFKDIESEALQKLYTMSLKSQSTLVREIVIHNLQNDVVHLNQFQTLI
jgi:glutaminyl-tRNA synthetase